MNTVLVSLFVVFLLHFSAANDPDVGLSMIDICTSKGYPIEEHTTVTSDGYILGLFRIPRGRNEPPGETTDKPVVFLQHGLEDSSYTWVNNFPGQSLGFILADAGYDVWFGNSRGNHYSKAHVKYPVDSKEFWDFTWDDMALKDQPAAIEYVLATSGRKSLSYIGHSQGTIIALSGFTSNSTLAAKIDVQVLLAPVAYAHHCSSPLLVPLADLDVDKLFEFVGVRQFLPDDSIIEKIDPLICKGFPHGCDDILFTIVGYSKNLNATRLDVYLSETPADTSVKNVAHWAQLVRKEEFGMYDYGCGLFSCKNKDHYGQKTPPMYDLSKVTIPTALYSGTNDVLADPKDVATLRSQLPKSAIVADVTLKNYAHLDFVWSPQASKDVYPDVLAVLKKYSKPSGQNILSAEQNI